MFDEAHYLKNHGSQRLGRRLVDESPDDVVVHLLTGTLTTGRAEDRAYRIGQTNTVYVSYLVAAGTIDEFVARLLEAKASLIDAVVEGGDLPADVLGALETLVSSVSPRLADTSGAHSGKDPVDRLLREVSQGFEPKSLIAAEARTKSGLSVDALERLAEVLPGLATSRYRLAGARRPGVVYTLDVDGGEVTCDCPGFEYRGSCSHARTLKTDLASGRMRSAEYKAVA